MSTKKSFRVAACHASPVYLNAAKTTQKAIDLTYEACRNGADLVAFPEVFVPGYPIWPALRRPTENHDLFKQYAQQSILIDGPEIRSIRRVARDCGVFISLGFSECVEYSAGCLFNSNVIISHKGEIVNHHRKLVPTFYEKLIWANGDGAGLRCVRTIRGTIGSLICGENTNPLARYTLMAQGEELHIASYPPIWPTDLRKSDIKSTAPSASTKATDAKPEDTTPESTSRKPKDYDNVTANRVRTAAHCFEAKCFGILVSSVLSSDAITLVTADLPSSDAEFVTSYLANAKRGATMILDPTGDVVDSFITDEYGGQVETSLLQAEEGILYADLDLSECAEKKQFHDVVGGYQRFDVFELKVNRTRQVPVTFTELDASTANKEKSQEMLTIRQ